MSARRRHNAVAPRGGGATKPPLAWGRSERRHRSRSTDRFTPAIAGTGGTVLLAEPEINDLASRPQRVTEIVERDRIGHSATAMARIYRLRRDAQQPRSTRPAHHAASIGQCGTDRRLIEFVHGGLQVVLVAPHLASGCCYPRCCCCCDLGVSLNPRAVASGARFVLIRRSVNAACLASPPVGVELKPPAERAPAAREGECSVGPVGVCCVAHGVDNSQPLGIYNGSGRPGAHTLDTAGSVRPGGQA